MATCPDAGASPAAGPSPQASAQAVSIPSLVKQPVNDAQRVVLRGNVHPLARPENDTGLAPDFLPMSRMLLVLKRSPQQEAALAGLLIRQQEKSSPQYHHWLTPQQFGQEFGPSDSDVQAVTDWLTSQGFEINRVSNGRAVIEFSGSAGLVRQVLGTEVHQYAVKGKSYWANASDPQIPAALAPAVAGIASLNNFPRKPMNRPVGVFSHAKKTGEIKPLYTIVCPQGYTCSAPAFFALGPTDFATIYNVLPLWNTGTDGTGQTIAIVSDSNINPQDVANFRSMFSLPPNPVNVILNGPDPGIIPGPETEADADTEWTGAVAKNATIDLVVSEDTEATAGVDLSALYIVDNNLAPVLSESYGSCESALGTAGNAFENAMWEQAAAEGITVLVATGDQGPATCDFPGYENAANNGLAVSGMASTPFNVAVGGTDFNNPSTYFNTTNNSTTRNSAKSYVPEITWNDSCARSGSTSGCSTLSGNGQDLTAGGGGASNCALKDAAGNCSSGYAKPPWQTGTGVPADSVRDIPDVSLFASDGFNAAFYIVCTSDGSGFSGASGNCSGTISTLDFVGIGGTSLSAPAFAGIMALVNQKTGERQGNANFVLYPLAAAAAAQNGNDCVSDTTAVGKSSCVFYDTINGKNASGTTITPGNISVACAAGSPNCKAPTGYPYGILVNPPGSTTPAFTTATGYDLATGLGSVNVANMVNNWSSVSFHSSGTTLGLTPTTLTHGQPVTANISVTSSAGTPTGDVALMGNPVTATNPTGSSNIGIATFTLGSGGTVSGSTNMLPGGTYNVFAHYAGDGNSGSSNSTPPISVTVNPENSTSRVSLVTFDLNTGQVTSTNATTVEYGSPYILRTDVLNAAGNQCAPNGTPEFSCPTGTVTLTANGQPIDNGTYTLNSQGYLEDRPIQIGGGTYALVATYAGDNSYNASTSPTNNVTITKAGTSTSANTPGRVSAGSPFTVSVTVNTQSNGAGPTGTVQVYNGPTPLGGPATCVGTAGRAAAFAFCQASVTITLDLTTQLSVQYSGDGNYAASTNAFGIVVYYTTTTVLTASPSGQTPAGTNITLTAVVTSFQNGGPAPIGTVNFTNTIAPITGTPTYSATAGTSSTPATLTATLVTSFQSWATVTAFYSGDSNYNSSNSPPIIVQSGAMPNFSLSASPSGSAVQAGSTANYTLTVTPTAGFNQQVAFACTGAPTKATCTVSPSIEIPNGTDPVNVMVTVRTTAPSLAPPGPRGGPPAPGGFSIHEWWFALLWLFVMGMLTLAFRQRRRSVPLLAGAILLAAIAMSCGGGGGGGGGGTTNPGTPKGTYTLTVTGVSGSLQHSTTVMLTVQ